MAACREAQKKSSEMRTGDLHPLDGLGGVVGDVDVDADGLAVIIQLHTEHHY